MPLKLLYHDEIPTLEGCRDGIIIYEAEPQRRMLTVRSQTCNFKTLDMPYMIFAVRYEVGYNTEDEDTIVKLHDNNACVYPGVHGCGLRVFCRENPMKSTDDLVCPYMTDVEGVVCTDHTEDNLLHENPEILAKSVINSWYSLEHTLSNINSQLPQKLPAALGWAYRNAMSHFGLWGHTRDVPVIESWLTEGAELLLRR